MTSDLKNPGVQVKKWRANAMARRDERRGAISSSDSQGKKMVFLRKKSFEIYVKYLATFPSAPIPPSKKTCSPFQEE